MTLIGQELGEGFLEVGLEPSILSHEFVHKVWLLPIEAGQVIVINVEGLFLILLQFFGHLDVVPDLLLLLVAIGVEGVVELIRVEHEAESLVRKVWVTYLLRKLRNSE